MGVLIYIDGQLRPGASYVVSESGTPLYANDVSGGVGSVTIDFPISANENPNYFRGRSYGIIDSNRGEVRGRIDSVRATSDSKLITVTGLPELGRLNIHNVRMPPMTGTLITILKAYLAKAGVSASNVEADLALETLIITTPGWYGDLWNHIKQLCAVYQCDITMTGKKVAIRRGRTRIVRPLGVVTRQSDWQPVQTASTVEVNRYDTRWTEGAQFYPNLANEDSPISLTAGQPTRVEIPLNGSALAFISGSSTQVTTIDPEYVENMTIYATSKTQFCVTYGNGKRLSKSQWQSGGGRLRVILNKDSTTATVIGIGPLGIFDGGDQVQSFTVSLQSNGITYNALRLRARGALINQTKYTLPTGIPAEQAEAEVGVTVDNIFVRTMSQVSEAAVDYATLSTGGNWTATTAVTKPSITDPAGALPIEQDIGAVGGARFFDPKTSSWFRIRSSSVRPDLISVESADLDNTFGDISAAIGDATYEDVQTFWYSGLTYEQARAMGVPGA